MFSVSGFHMEFFKGKEKLGMGEGMSENLRFQMSMILSFMDIQCVNSGDITT